MFLLICSNISFKKKNTASPQWDCETSCGRCTPDDPDPSNASRPDRGRRKIYFIYSSTEAGTNINWLTQQDSKEAKNAAKIAAKDPDLLWGSSQEHAWHARVVQPEVKLVWRSIWTQHLWRPKSGWAVWSGPWKHGQDTKRVIPVGLMTKKKEAVI